jgi:hypothetical protein
MSDKQKINSIKEIIMKWRANSGDEYGDEDFVNDVIDIIENKNILKIEPEEWLGKDKK